jgi:hypothetical protein
MADTYCIDTNIIVNLARRMPRDVYPGPWDAVEDLIATGRAFMPQDVYIELGRSADECAPWAHDLDGFVQMPTAAEIALVARISASHAGWVSERKNAADPFVIAHGIAFGRVVVTDERRRGPGVAAHNLGIPNVADAYGVQCLSFVDLARREGWRFTSG